MQWIQDLSLQGTLMKNNSIISSLLAATLAFGALPAVQAQQRGPDQSDQRDQHDNRGGDRHAPPQARDDHHDDRRGGGPDHSFHRGDRLPPEYRNRQYVVNDWRGHHLKAPPRGYQWVQNGADYMLVAIGTGVIMQLIFGN